MMLTGNDLDLPTCDELIGYLREVYDHAAVIDAREFVDVRDPSVIRNRVKVPMLTKVDDVLELLDLAQQVGSAASCDPPLSSDFLDVCFAASCEVRQVQSVLAAIDEVENRMLLLVFAAGVGGKIRRSLAGVLNTLGVGLAVPEGRVAQQQVRDAIRVRCAYARFREAVRDVELDEPEQVRTKMRGVLSAIEAITDTNLIVRLSDLLLLRDMATRIRDALKRPKAGLEWSRLRSELMSTSILLRAINNRHELLMNDRNEVRAVVGELAVSDDNLGPVLDRLCQLKGRDDELDAFVAEMSSRLQIMLERMRGELECQRGF